MPSFDDGEPAASACVGDKRGGYITLSRFTREPGVVNYFRYVPGVRDSHYLPLRMLFTPAQLRGWRAWFVCPRCDRRVRYLWTSSEKTGWDHLERGKEFGCARCWRVSYASERGR